MDGTGELFQPLLALLPDNIDAQVISLNSLPSQQPETLSSQVAKFVGDDEVIILAESYSGFIAYNLCLNPDLNIKHVFFAASFLSSPSRLIVLRHLVPLSIIRSSLIPKRLLNIILFGFNAHSGLVELFLTSLQSVSNSSLKHRLNYISNMVEPTQQIAVPCTYIQASNDYLVSNRSVNAFKALCTTLNIIETDGGHFIVQSNPQLFVKLINDLINQ
ncbi:MAG: hypothetical protein COA90_01505 [Gammaproteobacteria bacterium]|nr:MAG: hypothetical protein COA90_01505 [Gammaproteobacteria bacterium]